MWSNPSYDPTPLAGHRAREVQAAYDALNGDPAKPMLPRAFRERYAPGSTFKVVTAATALEAGVATTDRRFPCAAEPRPAPVRQGAAQLRLLQLRRRPDRRCSGARATPPSPSSASIWARSWPTGRSPSASARTCPSTCGRPAARAGAGHVRAQPASLRQRRHRPGRRGRHPPADGHGGGRHRQRRRDDGSRTSASRSGTRDGRVVRRTAGRGVEAGHLAPDGGHRRADDGRGGPGRDGPGGGRPRGHRGRQDRYGRGARGPAPRLVHRLRPGRGPPAGGGGHRGAGRRSGRRGHRRPGGRPRGRPGAGQDARVPFPRKADPGSGVSPRER